MIPAEIVGMYYTATERKLMEMLSDGKAHSIEELCFWKDSNENALRVFIHKLRQKVYGSRYRIYAGFENGESGYRLVMLFPGVT